MMNLYRLITPLRLMIVDDELRTNKMDKELQEVADRLVPGSEIISFSKATRAKEELKKLKEQGKNVHAVAMDYKLNADDLAAIEFLTEYIAQNPTGYWFWSSAYPAEAYNDLLASPNKKSLHPQMLTGYNKSDGGFKSSLRHLISCLEGDLRKHRESDTKVVILTARATLNISAGSLVREEQNQEFSILDELVPGCQYFENAIIIHVPFLPDNATCFTDAVISRQSGGRVKTSEQRLLRSAWVARKYFEPVHVMTASKVSKDFDSSNWRKYASQFNLNLTWLDVASESDWSGSILITYDGGTDLNEDLEAVARAKKAGAVWSKIGPRNFNSQFRPWAAVYRLLQAPAFFQGIDINSGELKGCDEGLPLEAASGSINMRVSPDAKLYIDRGDHLYDIRKRVKVPFQESVAEPQTSSFSPSTAPALLKPTAAPLEETPETAKTNSKRGSGKKPSVKGKTIRRDRR